MSGHSCIDVSDKGRFGGGILPVSSQEFRKSLIRAASEVEGENRSGDG